MVAGGCVTYATPHAEGRLPLQDGQTRHDRGESAGERCKNLSLSLSWLVVPRSYLRACMFSLGGGR